MPAKKNKKKFLQKVVKGCACNKCGTITYIMISKNKFRCVLCAEVHIEKNM